MIYPKFCNTCIQDQLNATKNKTGEHYLHIELVNIVQLTCKTHIVNGGRSIVHDANM